MKEFKQMILESKLAGNSYQEMKQVVLEFCLTI